MRTSLAFVIIIIFVIYLYHPHYFDITPKKKYGPITRMRTSIVFVIIIILVINSNQKLLSYHVNEKFSRICDNYYLCHIFISPSLFWITPTKEIWSYRMRTSIVFVIIIILEWNYCPIVNIPIILVINSNQQKKYGPITWMRTSIVFVIIIILVINSNQKLLLSREWELLSFITLIYITPTKEIWSYHANENFYRLRDYYYSCHKLQPKTTVLSREWELLSHLW